eukprot:PhM_4_TR1722/c0_g1_i6/m.30594/K08857/NEK1_4_5; NIMA (never in mitosis gene a)-related kinase 1/4/5
MNGTIRAAWQSYHKIKSLGSGAGGQVYVASGVPDKGGVPGTHVVKRIYLHEKDDDLKQAANEIHLLRVLQHPNIVKYVDDFFDDEGYLNIVMEYCECGDLAMHISDLAAKGEKMPIKQIVYLAFQLITGVRYLHSRNIVHRDLKPNNIFLVHTDDGMRLKIADFGISRTLGPNSVAETVVGTPHYLSPEVCESAPYTNKADMWAVGVVIYEMATLKRPFEGTNLLAVVRKISAGRYVPLGEELSAIQQMLNRLLVVDPAKRATAYEMERIFYTSGLVQRPPSGGSGRSPGRSPQMKPAASTSSTSAPHPPPPPALAPDDYEDDDFESADDEVPVTSQEYGDDFDEDKD